MSEIPFEKTGGDVFGGNVFGGNVFGDMGFAPAEAAELTVRSALITSIGDTIRARKLTQQEAARLCGTDQPTLSKVLRGRMESVTIDRLTAYESRKPSRRNRPRITRRRLTAECGNRDSPAHYPADARGRLASPTRMRLIDDRRYFSTWWLSL